MLGTLDTGLCLGSQKYFPSKFNLHAAKSKKPIENFNFYVNDFIPVLKKKKN